MCPTNVAIYDIILLTCGSSLFFQTAGDKQSRRRSLLLHYITPTLQRHCAVWIYHFPCKRQVTIRCPHGTNWITYNKVLSGAGVIYNARACIFASSERRTLPELHGTAYVRVETPTLYLPDLSPNTVGSRDASYRRSTDGSKRAGHD